MQTIEDALVLDLWTPRHGMDNVHSALTVVLAVDIPASVQGQERAPPLACTDICLNATHTGARGWEGRKDGMTDMLTC